MPEYFVRVVPLPTKVRGLVTPNDDDTFNIYINANLPEEKQQAALSHEVEHLVGDHLYDDRPIEELEREASRHTA